MSTPLSLIPISSAKTAISESIWLEINIVFPLFLDKSSINVLISAIPIGSKPLIGSSKINISGSCITANAIANRCFIPNEYCEYNFLSL